MKKKHKVALLPSERSALLKHVSGMLLLNTVGEIEQTLYIQPQHLYILSDDEIKKEDWIYDDNYKTIFQSKEVKTPSWCFKIIATTDPSLNLPLIDNDSIKWYCKNPVDEVMVEFIRGYMFDTTNPPKELNQSDITSIAILSSIKSTWTKEEVEKLCEGAWRKGYDLCEYHCHIDSRRSPFNLMDWLKENL